MSRMRQWLGQALPRPLIQQLKKWYYPRKLRKFDERNWPGAVVVRALIEPGDTVLDAGANIGYVSMLLARWVGPAGRVCSFEPVPDTYDILVNNVRKLGLAQVMTFPCAVSSRKGEARMEVPRYESGYENLYEARVTEQRDAAAGLRYFPVAMTRIDDVIRPEWKVSFIKMDVEGHEWDAVHGAARTIEAGKPSLMIEVTGDPDEADSPSSKLFSHLQAQGYSAYWWDGATLRPRAVKDQHIDYFFLTQGHLKKLAARGIHL